MVSHPSSGHDICSIDVDSRICSYMHSQRISPVFHKRLPRKPSPGNRICRYCMRMYPTFNGIFQTTSRNIKALGFRLATLVCWQFNLPFGNMYLILGCRTSFCTIRREKSGHNSYSLRCYSCSSSPYFNVSTLQGKFTIHNKIVRKAKFYLSNFQLHINCNLSTSLIQASNHNDVNDNEGYQNSPDKDMKGKKIYSHNRLYRLYFFWKL